MSIASQINRINQNVSDAFDAIEAKGVTIPSGSNSDDLADLIGQIQQGGSSGGIVITDTQDVAGGTVRTITAVQISGTKTITENGTGIDVAEYAAVDVNVPSSGADMPTITVTFDDNWEQIISASFDKTYSECVAYIDDGIVIANVIITTQSGTEQYPAQATLTISGGAFYQTYTVLNGVVPGFDIKYNSNGTVEITNPSALRETLNITSNGTYYPTGINYIEEVNVNVSGGTYQAKTHITPTESSQTITADQNYDALSSVQIDPISSTYVGSGITQRSSSDLTASGATVTVPAGYYSAQSSKAVASGTAGTPTATKGTVSNHQVSVTPSVTNQTGYITGSTETGTAVTVSASELVSGSETKTENGTYDVTNLAQLVVDVPASGDVNVDTKTATASNYPTSLSFTEMLGQPKMFTVRLNAQVSSSGSTSYYYIVDITSHGTTTHGNCFRIGSTRRVDNITSGYSWSYSGTTLTITSSASSRSASPGAFYSGSYELMYVY